MLHFFNINKLFIIIFIFFFNTDLILFAKEHSDPNNKPVTVIGDYLEYKTNEEIVISKGNAHVYQKELDLKANNIQVDMKKNILFAEGNVILWQKNNKTTGDFLIYDLKTGKGTIENAKYFQGSSIIYASNLEFSPRLMKGENILWTSCLHEPTPHYSTRAKKITIYANDRMVLNNVSFYAGKTRLYHKNKDIISLKKIDRKIKNKYSYSKLNGLYVKTTYDYFLNSTNYGTAFYDFYQKKGNTFGVEHRLTNGSLYYTNISDPPHRTENNLNLTYNKKLFKKYDLNINSNVFARKYEDSAIDKELQYTIHTSHSNSRSFFTRYDITLDGRLDLDGDSYTLDNTYNVLQKMPEIKIDCKQLNTKKLNLTITTNITAARYIEVKNDNEESLYSLDINNRYNFKTMNLSDITRLQLSGESRVTAYSGDHRYSITGRSTLNHKYNENLLQEISYTRKVVKGESPFNFDTEYERNYMNSFFKYKLNKYINFKLSNFSYDFEDNRFYNIYNEFEIRSSNKKKNSWSFYTKFSYDAINKNFRKIFNIDTKLNSIYLRYNIRPENKNWYFNASSSYITNTHKFEYIDSQNNFKLGHKMQVTSSMRYDFSMSKLTSQRYDLIYDMDCFESKLSYDINKEEVLFEFYLKAFPNKKRTIFYDIKNNLIKPKIKNLDY